MYDILFIYFSFVSSDGRATHYSIGIMLRYWMMKSNDWIIVKKSLCDKSQLVISNLRVLSYFSVSILFLGGAGVWLPWLSSNTTFDSYFRGDNIFTFVLAILGGLLCNKVFNADRIVVCILDELKFKLKNNQLKNENDFSKILHAKGTLYKRQLALSAVGFFVGSLSLIFVIVGYTLNSNDNSWCGIIGLLLSLALYIFSMAEDIDESSKIQSLSIDDDFESIFGGADSDSSEMFKDK